MNDNKVFERRKSINSDIRNSVNNIIKNSNMFLKSNFTDLQICDYIYNPKEAVEELGLDEDLVNQLVEDYVSQILKSRSLFIGFLKELKIANLTDVEYDYTQLRELAHKNLGVARNLRIIDGIKVLDKLMKENDLKYLILCVKALESCAIRLKPRCAYETLKLMQIKSSL